MHERLSQLDDEVDSLRAQLDELEEERRRLEERLAATEAERDAVFDELYPSSTPSGRTLPGFDEFFALLRKPPQRPKARRMAPVSSEGLSTSQAAALIGHSPRTLEAWRLRGEGPPYFKIGARVVYREADLLEFRDRGRVEPGS